MRAWNQHRQKQGQSDRGSQCRLSSEFRACLPIGRLHSNQCQLTKHTAASRTSTSVAPIVAAQRVAGAQSRITKKPFATFTDALLVKLSPDIDDVEMESTVEVIKAFAIDGIIATNTT